MAVIKAPDGTKTGWGSHQPALRALAKFTEIRSVIEFGAGLYSTHLFLDLEAFPHLTSLVTFEHDKTWAEKVRVDDERHTLIIKPAEEFAAISKSMKSDFVFVDCAPNSIRLELLSHAITLSPIIAIHDCLEKNLDGLEFVHIKGFNKTIQTVFASNTVDLSGLELE